MDKETSQILTDNDLGSYIAILDENNIDKELLSELNEDDYSKLGFTGDAVRKMLELFSSNYKKEAERIPFENISQVADCQIVKVEPVSTFSKLYEVSPVQKLLVENDLSEYVTIFERHKLNNFDVISRLTENDLSELGVIAIGDRKKIKDIFKIKENVNDKANNIVVTQSVEKEKSNAWPIAIAVIISAIIIGVIIYYAIPWWWRY